MFLNLFNIPDFYDILDDINNDIYKANLDNMQTCKYYSTATQLSIISGQAG